MRRGARRPCATVSGAPPARSGLRFRGWRLHYDPHANEGVGLGKLYREVVAVRLSTRNVYLPDLAFVPVTKVDDLEPTHIPFAPALVVEVLSPRTADRDTGPKFASYEEQGVGEYWILDPESGLHRFYRREGELLVEFAAGEDLVRSSSVPGFWMRRAWLDLSRLPPVAACPTEQGGTPPPPPTETSPAS